MKTTAPGAASRHTFLLALGAAAALGACSFAPTYKTPETATPAAYKEVQGEVQGNDAQTGPQAGPQTSDWKSAQPADSQSRGDWWSLFQDPQLDTLEAKVGAANQDLKASFARLLQARAETRIARADYFPTVTLGPAFTRQRQSTNSPVFDPKAPQVYNNFSLEADVSYEIDVWGRVRNAVAAARADQQASAADLATLDLSTHAELASDYYMLRSDDAEQDLLDRTVIDYQKALQLTQNLYTGGAAALTDVAQAQAQLETAQTQAADIHLQRAQLEHAIAVLVGEPASSFRIDPQPLPLDTAPPAIDAGLPSALLERRPDIAAAERRVAAANFQIGVARAAFFPVFSLSASAGLDSLKPSNWITAPSRFWSLGPSASLTVFDAGRHSAQTDQAHAAYDEVVADYRGSVLNAYREVEDNLAALHQLEQESRSQAAAVTATQTELAQANYRYKGGVATYLEVATAENAALQAQVSASSIQARRLDASVLLVKALGGNWQGNTELSVQKPAVALSAETPP